MLEIRRILAPTDFSDTSKRAVEYAAGLARRFGAELVLLHVVELPAGMSPSMLMRGRSDARLEPVGEYLTDTSYEALRELQSTLPPTDAEIALQVEIGDADRVIPQVAEQLPADLIVLGTHGRTGLRHLLLGSVAERVVRLSRVPVLTIRAEEAFEAPAGGKP